MPAGNTFTPIQTTIIPNSTTSSYTFSSIPQTYNELYLVCTGYTTTAGDNSLALQFNGDTSGSYGWVGFDGNNANAVGIGSTSSVTGSNAQFGLITSNGVSVSILRVIGYSTDGIYKGVLGQAGFSTRVRAYTGLWNNTAAITSLTVFITPNAANWVAGATLTLYGIARA
jgi:hypothetical protein